MAMTTCRACDGAVAADARTCPGCGSRAPSATRQRARNNTQALVVLGVFAALLVLLYVLGF